MLDSFSPSTDLDVVRLEGDMCFFLGTWLVTSPIVAMSFTALIQINLTVTALALTCKFQVNCFPFSEVRPIQQASPLL
jgi:hypothetical protein